MREIPKLRNEKIPRYTLPPTSRGRDYGAGKFLAESCGKETIIAYAYPRDLLCPEWAGQPHELWWDILVLKCFP